MSYHSELDIHLRNIALYGYDPNGGDETTAAAKLGGEVVGQFIHCPSPGRGPEDRSCVVRITEGTSPFIYACVGSQGAAYKMVRAKLGMTEGARSSNSAQALRLWEETIPVAAGSHVERYLRGRSITLPVPACIRYHGHCWHRSGPWSAMVAARTDANGAVVAVHRTYLSSGHKAPIDPNKMDLGPVGGTAIRLALLAEEIMVGEGIETTLSAMQSEGLPGWAAGSAIAMRMLILPAAVRSIIILADGDQAGHDAARAAATRWQREGRRVRIVSAPPGKDFNDVLRECVA